MGKALAMRGQNQTKSCCSGISGRVSAAKTISTTHGLSLLTEKAPGA